MKSKKIKSFASNLFITAFCLITVSRLMESSALFPFSSTFYNAISFIALFLLVVKYILDWHTYKEYIVFVLLILVVGFLCIKGAPFFIIPALLFFVTIKGVDIRQIIKIDIAIKSIFLLSHALLYLIDFVTGEPIALEFMGESTKGVFYTLYFLNPNTTGLLCTWLAIELLFLKGSKKKFKDFILPTLIVVVAFAITTSRTPFYTYGIFILLQLIKSEKITYYLQKMVYPMLAVLSLYIVAIADASSPIYGSINELISGRLSHSLIAYNAVGMQILPSNQILGLFEKMVLDNFFIRCFVQYGIIFMILYYIQYLLLPRGSSKDVKDISILMNIYLFFEVTIAFAGFAIPNIIIADAVINNREQKNEKTK